MAATRGESVKRVVSRVLGARVAQRAAEDGDRRSRRSGWARWSTPENIGWRQFVGGCCAGAPAAQLGRPLQHGAGAAGTTACWLGAPWSPKPCVVPRDTPAPKRAYSIEAMIKQHVQWHGCDHCSKGAGAHSAESSVWFWRIWAEELTAKKAQAVAPSAPANSPDGAAEVALPYWGTLAALTVERRSGRKHSDVPSGLRCASLG